MSLFDKFIEHLRIKYPVGRIRYSDDIHDPEFQQYFNISSDQLSFNPEDYLDFLYQRFLKSTLPQEVVNQVDNQQIRTICIAHEIPNCYVKFFSEQSAIVMSQGLSRLFFRIIRLLCKIMLPAGDDPRNQYTIEEIGYKLGEILWWFNKTRMPWGPSYPISKYQLEYASDLTRNAEIFFLAHEFSHIWFDILKKAKHPGTGFIEGHEEEFQADYYGALFTLRIKTVPKLLLIAGVMLGLDIFIALETSWGIDFGETHPPMSERRKMIEAALVSNSTEEGYCLFKEGPLGRDMLKIFAMANAISLSCNEGTNVVFERKEEEKREEFWMLLKSYSEDGWFETKFSEFINMGFVHVIAQEVYKIHEEAENGNPTSISYVILLVAFFTKNYIEPVSPFFLRILKGEAVD